MIVEQEWSLSADERAGVDIQPGGHGGCYEDFFHAHDGVVVACAGEAAELRTDGSVRCEVEPRALQVLIQSTHRTTDCQIFCHSHASIVWATE